MLEFYKGKRVFITGHSGFKGTWLCKILVNAGAIVTGYALEPPTMPNLYSICGVSKHINSIIGDIRDIEKLKKSFKNARPEIAFHMAAQPIVRESYKNPHYTYETNVMGTVNFLECIRENPVKSVLNVTTDKVYLNNEWVWGYRENEPLNGFDPYSNSKSCSELVTQCYKNSFFANSNVSLSTARSGNVIGGGDFADDRIIPDCIRAAERKEMIFLRNPSSTRPYQHVIDTLNAYLMIAEKQYHDKRYEGSYNVGPEDNNCVTTGNLANLFCKYWGDGLTWIHHQTDGPHEANFLKLDCSKVKNTIGWRPKWDIEKAVEKTVEWAKAYYQRENVISIMDRQIEEFFITK